MISQPRIISRIIVHCPGSDNGPLIRRLVLLVIVDFTVGVAFTVHTVFEASMCLRQRRVKPCRAAWDEVSLPRGTRPASETGAYTWQHNPRDMGIICSIPQHCGQQTTSVSQMMTSDPYTVLPTPRNICAVIEAALPLSCGL
jgi:hypothetical protein